MDDVLDDDRRRCRRVERNRSREHLVEDNSQAIDVGTAVELFTKALLRRHIVWGSENATRLREISPDIIAELGNAKVEHLYPNTSGRDIDDDVVWFDVSMNDVMTMGFI